MRSKIARILIAVLIAGITIPAFAAVENIKVGGDIDIYGIRRSNFENGEYDNQDFFQTSTRVYVNATLTDGVEAMVRLTNERLWGITVAGDSPYYDYRQNILLDLAYIKVSDILTSGLALTVGKQEIQFGEGLVVGSAYIPYIYPSGDTWIMASDLGKQKAFDAIRVDYTAAGAPVDVTAFMAKIDENIYYDWDGHLYGVNVGFGMDVARLEGYYVRLQNMADTNENVTTAGIRVTGDWAGFGLKGEYAKQFGEWMGDTNSGWALLLGGRFGFPTSELGAYIKANLNLYSGYDGSGDNTQWITYFPANVAQRIGSINYVLATTWLGPNGLNNAQVINIGGGIRPVEKIGLSLDWFNVNLMEDTFWSGGEKGLGNEIEAAMTFDYTEDLSFGLQYGVLLLGDAMDGVLDENPWQLIGSMKLAF